VILFCDTSALVKLYIQEEFSELAWAHANQATVIAVSRISWVEAMAALARRVHDRPVDAKAIDTVRNNLRTDWASFAKVEITQALVEMAGEYADTFALRAYDSVQLASARMVQEASNEAFCFACFDIRLQKVARALDMQTLGKM